MNKDYTIGIYIRLSNRLNVTSRSWVVFHL